MKRKNPDYISPSEKFLNRLKDLSKTFDFISKPTPVIDDTNLKRVDRS